MPQLPPDLSTLGDQLALAAEARLHKRRRLRVRLQKLLGTGLAAALALTVLAPGPISPADRGLFQLAAAEYVPAACDQPRGATFAAAHPCNPPGTTDALPGSLARPMAER